MLAKVGNFHFDSLSPFLSIVCILSSQTILLQIFFYALFPRFPRSFFLPFPSYFNFHTLTYLGMDVSMHDHPRRFWTITSSIFTATPILSWRTLVDTHSTSLTPHIILITWGSTPCNLASSATVGSSHVSRQYHKNGLTEHW